MANQSSRTRNAIQRKRRFPREFAAQFLVETLNGESTEQRMAKVESLATLIRCLLELQELFRSMPKGIKTSDSELKRVRAAVNDCLSQYLAIPVVTLDSPCGDLGRKSPLVIRGWSLQWERVERWPMLKLAGIQHIEMSAALIAVNLAQTGQLASLKQCKQCQRWLFARFSHQTFCSEQCKGMFHHTNPDEKKRRRDWARENYQSRKELERGSREAAKRKGRKR